MSNRLTVSHKVLVPVPTVTVLLLTTYYLKGRLPHLHLNLYIFTVQVALLQMALSDGFCVLVRTCQIEKFPESLKQVLARYDVIKLGVAVCEDGKKVT